MSTEDPAGPRKGPAEKTDFPADQICSQVVSTQRVSRRGGNTWLPVHDGPGQVRIDRVVPTVRSGRTEQIKLMNSLARIPQPQEIVVCCGLGVAEVPEFWDSSKRRSVTDCAEPKGQTTLIGAQP